MKQIQHPITSDHEKPRIVEKIADTSRFDHTKLLAIEYLVGKPCEQLVENDFQVGKAWPTVMGAVKGRFRSINDCARGGFHSFKWVAQGIKALSPEYVSLGLKDLEAQNTLVSKPKDSLGPCKTSPSVFEISECSEPSFSPNPSSLKVIEAKNILCPSAPKPDIPGKSSIEHKSSVFGSTTTEIRAMSTMVAELSISMLAKLNNSDGDAQEMSIKQAQLLLLPVLTVMKSRSSPV
nr:hypothetical protein CFP56_05457 [Quercus suber]